MDFIDERAQRERIFFGGRTGIRSGASPNSGGGGGGGLEGFIFKELF